MASLKLAQNQAIQSSQDTLAQTIIFNPITGISTREAEQANTLFFNEVALRSELSMGDELLMITKR